MLSEYLIVYKMLCLITIILSIIFMCLFGYVHHIIHLYDYFEVSDEQRSLARWAKIFYLSLSLIMFVVSQIIYWLIL